MEQKRLMLSMCQYLNNSGYPLPEDILPLSKIASDSALIIHMIALMSRLNSSCDDSISKRLSKQFDSIVNVEKEYIPVLLRFLLDKHRLN